MKHRPKQNKRHTRQHKHWQTNEKKTLLVQRNEWSNETDERDHNDPIITLILARLLCLCRLLLRLTVVSKSESAIRIQRSVPFIVAGGDQCARFQCAREIPVYNAS